MYTEMSIKYVNHGFDRRQRVEQNNTTEIVWQVLSLNKNLFRQLKHNLFSRKGPSATGFSPISRYM